MRFWGVVIGVIACVAALPASAQNYNQVIAFGDSTTDTGWFANANTGNPIFNQVIQFSLAAGGNAHSTGPGPGNAQILASFFGLTANPANTAGGTNYAISGAVDNSFFGFTNIEQLTGGFSFPNSQLPSTTGQIADYLASVNGHANPNAVYLFSTGGNSIFLATFAVDGVLPPLFQLTIPQANAYLLGEAQALSASIGNLQAAGARYIIVANEYAVPSAAITPNETALGQTLFTATWNDLAADHVHFIPADTQSVIAAVESNPLAFGITAPITSNACMLPPSLAAFGPIGYGAVCAPVLSSNPLAPTGYLVSADALQTHLFMDGVHLTEAGQQIVADYYYSLLTAPSEISFLAENAVKTRLSLISSIQNQIDASETRRGPLGFNAWVSGDITSISMDNYHGFPGDPNTVWNGAGGVDFTLAPGLIGGIAVSIGTLNAALGEHGSFKQQESTASLYAAYRSGPIWGTVIGTAGQLDYNSNRVVPIGITLQ
ncbi:MAG: SGNH/GDSL hydrolase family protein, partial [Rhodomicrobium sp.]